MTQQIQNGKAESGALEVISGWYRPSKLLHRGGPTSPAVKVASTICYSLPPRGGNGNLYCPRVRSKRKQMAEGIAEIPGFVDISVNMSFDKPLHQTVVHWKRGIKEEYCKRLFNLTYSAMNSTFIIVKVCGQAHCQQSLSAVKI